MGLFPASARSAQSIASNRSVVDKAEDDEQDRVGKAMREEKTVMTLPYDPERGLSILFAYDSDSKLATAVEVLQNSNIYIYIHTYTPLALSRILSNMSYNPNMIRYHAYRFPRG